MIMNNAFNTFKYHLAPLTVQIDHEWPHLTENAQQTNIQTKNDLAFSKSYDSAAILRQILSLEHLLFLLRK